MTEKRRWASVFDSADVGSSRMSNRGSWTRARVRSSICCSAIGSSYTSLRITSSGQSRPRTAATCLALGISEREEAALGTALFLGGWQSPIGILPGVIWFLLKMYFLVFTVVWIRWTFPRTQFYGLLNLSWKILIPVSLFTRILSSAMMKLFHT